MRTLIILFFCSTVTMSASAQLVNGSFEPVAPFGSYWALAGASTNIPGWVTTDTGVEWFNPFTYGVGSAGNGNYALDLANTVYSAGGIQQTFTTVPGSLYEISFLLGTSTGYGRLGTCEISVTADGFSQVFVAENFTPIIAWEIKQFVFIADDTQATLQFRCVQNANIYFAYIDGVSTSGTVPADGTTWGELKATFR